MIKEKISGIVKRLETINDDLSVATIFPLDKNSSKDKLIPLYANIRQDFRGKLVEVTNEREYLGKGRFKQKVVGNDVSVSVDIPYKEFERINRYYEKCNLKSYFSN